MTDISETNERSAWTGADFEFLLSGDLDISKEDYDKIMTPKSFEWNKIIKDDWPYYQIGQDEFSYSWEEPGIQMTFNNEITFEKAKRIADEIIQNIETTGQDVELIILNKENIYRFD